MSSGVEILSFSEMGMPWRVAAVAICFAAQEFGFGFFGLCEGEIGGDGDVRIQFGVELHDACEHDACEFDGRQFALAEKAGDVFGDGGEGQVGVGRWGT